MFQMMKVNFLKKQKKLSTSQKDHTEGIMKDKIYEFYQRKSVWKKKKSKSFKNQKLKGSKIWKKSFFF